MRVLLVGSGGREHALAAGLAAAPSVSALFAAPGNPGIAAHATLVPIAATDIESLVAFARAEAIDLVVPGPEAPLVAGLADLCGAASIPCAGPTRAAAALEGSKAFARAVAEAAGVPGPRWERFDDPAAALEFVRRRGAPIVVKADGLAAGKGVVVATTLVEAEAAIEAMMRDAALGDAGRAVVIEECLEGDEVSLFALCDGSDAMLLGAAQDHKRIGDGDTGPNTGGMGAVTPPRGFDRARQEGALDVFVRPVLAEMARRGIPFRGVLFTGLMLTAAGARLIEYNVRLGDPEAQCLLPLLEGDLGEALMGCATGALGAGGPWQIGWRLADAASVAVVLASPGYPGTPVTGERIEGLEAAALPAGARIFHSGTRAEDGAILSAGGRVLTVQARAPDLAAARRLAYEAIGHVRWPNAVFRRDIGRRSLAPAGG